MAAKKSSIKVSERVQKLIDRANEPKSPIMQKLFDAKLELIISWGEFSVDYFGKPRTWLSSKIQGCDLDCNDVDITAEEIKQLKEALFDLSKRIENCANTL